MTRKDGLPPIPPNCEIIPQADGDLWYGGMFFDPDSSTHCTIIACIAAEHWLIEQRRWKTLPVNDCKNFDSIADYAQQASDYANVWRKWGGLIK